MKEGLMLRIGALFVLGGWIGLLGCCWRAFYGSGRLETAAPPPRAATDAPVGFIRTPADDESDRRAAEPSPSQWQTQPEAARRTLERLRRESAEGAQNR